MARSRITVLKLLIQSHHRVTLPFSQGLPLLFSNERTPKGYVGIGGCLATGEDDTTSTGPLQRIEWTGAGGDYYLAVVVDERNEIVGEFWGTRKQVLGWIERQTPRLNSTYVPMALGATRKRAQREALKAQSSATQTKSG